MSDLAQIYDCLPDGVRPGEYSRAHAERYRVDIADVLARTDLVDLIGESVELKQEGKDFHARCPFHDERTPSFTVSRDKQFFHCFGCGAHGDALDWLQQYDRLTFRQALEALAGRAGIDMPAEQRGALRAKRNKSVRFRVETAVWSELLILSDAIGERVTYRQIDQRTRARYPHIQPVPDDPSEREFEAARQVALALKELYGVRA